MIGYPRRKGYNEAPRKMAPRKTIRGGMLNYLHARRAKVQKSLDKQFGKTADFKPSWHSWGVRWGGS